MAAKRRLPSTAAGLLLVLSTLGAGCTTREIAVAPPSPPPFTPPVAPVEKVASTADIVAAALPAVVLILNERPGKPGGPSSTTFGAGFLTRDGLVVTSLHVVDGDGKLSAMLYKPGRQGYTPMDGGLGRLLFENQSDLVPAERIAADGVTDLAVLRVKADTSNLPRLVWSNEDVRPGDRVLALGHPQETVWSFSEGVVGALQYGIVQHTAIVGPGSSGGPLLNAKGEVVGVNIAKVMNQATGLSFARPIAIVASTFSDKKVASPLDQSTPAAAALSCWRAQQLALPETGECFDWDYAWDQYKRNAEEARRLVTTDEAKKTIDTCHLGPHAKAGWIAMSREHAIHVFDPEYSKACEAKGNADKTAASAATLWKSPDGTVKPESTPQGFVADYLDPKRFAERLRNGLRVEGTHPITEDLAWVLLASRGADGSVAQFTELYQRVNGKWVQRMLPQQDHVAALPTGWPEPVMTFATKRPLQIAAIVKEAGSNERCPFASPSDAASSPGGAGRAVLRLGFSQDP